MILFDEFGIPLRPLPFRVRPIHLETPESYWHRLAGRNFEPRESLNRHVKTLLNREKGLTRLEAECSVIETLGGLRGAHFLKERVTSPCHSDGQYCTQCHIDIEKPLACRKCTQGERINQIPHLRMVCLKHRVWTGYSVELSDQIQVTDAIYRAERKLRSLINHHRVDAMMIHNVRMLLLEGRSGTRANVEVFPDLVRLIGLLVNPGFVDRFLKPTNSFESAQNILYLSIERTVSRPYANLTGGIWSYYRPVFVRIRECLEARSSYSQEWVHDMPVPDSCLSDLANSIGPPEGLFRYFDDLGLKSPYQVERSYSSLLEDRIIHHPVFPEFNLARDGYRESNPTVNLEMICLWGHRRMVDRKKFIAALAAERSGCAYCSGHWVMPGFNDLETRLPIVASSWHPVLNLGVDPREVLAGGATKWWWICSIGHAYRCSVPSRVLRYSCYYCTNRKVLTGYNDLATLRPDLASEWDLQKNMGVGPHEVPATTTRKYWWRCSVSGQLHFQSPYYRSRRVSPCPFCSD
jgi:hypothetical protein